MELTFWDLVFIGLSSGVGVQSLQWVGDKFFEMKQQEKDQQHDEARHLREIAHQRAMQDEQLAHERRLLRYRAHADAAAASVVDVAQARDWIDYQLTEVHGRDVGFDNNVTPPPPAMTVMGVVAVFRATAATHPTKAVRARAKRLENRISGFYNEYSPGPVQPDHPSADEMSAWVQAAEDLLDLIHGSPPEEA